MKKNKKNIYSLIICFLICFWGTSQNTDTLFLNNYGESSSETKYLSIDAIFIIRNGQKEAMDIMVDSVLVFFNNRRGNMIEKHYVETKKFFLLLNREQILDSCYYIFWAKVKNNYYPFYIISEWLNEERKTTTINLYQIKKWIFLTNNYGFTIGSYANYTDLTDKVKKIGDLPKSSFHLIKKNICLLK